MADELVSGEFIQRANLGASVVTAGLAATRFAVEGIAPVGIVLASTSLSLALAWAISHRERLLPLGRWMLPLCGLAGISTMSIVEGQLNSEALFWLPFVPMVAILAVGRMGGILCATLATIHAGGLIFLSGPRLATFFQAMGLIGAVVFAAMVGLAYSTARRREAEQLEAALRDAQAASQAKSEFLASMSHELRTPLNAIIGFSSVIAKGRTSEKRPAEVLATRIRTNGEHLLELINDVLDLSKVEAGKLEFVSEPIDVSVVLHDSLRATEALAREKQIEVRAPAEAQVARAVGDDLRLKQVVVNLLSNAVKFTESGGLVEVSLLVSSDGDAQRLDVTDTGPGIAPEDSERVFELFRQVEQSKARRHEGTGLGLALARRLCERMGYRLELVSAASKGCIFSIYFDDSAPTLTEYVAPSAHGRE